MKWLALESSAISASVAVYEEGKLIAQAYNNTKITHSQTLMPMIEGMLKCAQIELNDIDGFAVSVGPGSFTGVRIGVSVVKGLAFHSEKPCAPVSTLEAMAWMFMGQNVNVCAVMDARCGQTYNALFKVSGNNVERITEDRALSVDELINELIASGEEWILAGDGADVFVNKISGACDKVSLAAPHLRYQQAFGVACAADRMHKDGATVPGDALMPTYLRLPQAERELNEKMGKKA